MGRERSVSTKLTRLEPHQLWIDGLATLWRRLTSLRLLLAEGNFQQVPWTRLTRQDEGWKRKPWTHDVLIDVVRNLTLTKNNWWRRRESNPRPRTLRPRFYMLSQLFNLTVGLPSGRNPYGGSGDF